MRAEEVPLTWRKAAASNGSNGNCVELAPLIDGGVAMRDSKDKEGPVLRFSQAQWIAFVHGMAAGEFDPLIG